MKLTRQLIALFTIGLSGCTVSKEARPLTRSDLDTNLFELVVASADSARPRDEVRVDPRPLVPSPDLVTLHGVGGIIPERLRATEHSESVLDDAKVLDSRRAVLQRIGIAETDAFQDVECPGALIPPLEEVMERRTRHCPSDRFVSLIMSVPRRGGAYWPDNVDERAKYPGDIYSVRVIERSMSRQGSVEVSVDYIFSCQVARCRLVERRSLLIVE